MSCSSSSPTRLCSTAATCTSPTTSRPPAWRTTGSAAADPSASADRMSTALEQRIVELETRLAFQEQALAELSDALRSEEHTSELQSLMRISYAVFCLKKKTKKNTNVNTTNTEL